MTYCFVVFTDPGRVFESLHRTVDGATVAAASCGAASMPDGSPIVIDAVGKVLLDAPSISFRCDFEDGVEGVHIERHVILV